MSGGDVPIPCWGVGGTPGEMAPIFACDKGMYVLHMRTQAAGCVCYEGGSIVESVFFLVPNALFFALMFSCQSRYICQCAVSASRILLILISPPCYPCSESEMFLGM